MGRFGQGRFGSLAILVHTRPHDHAVMLLDEQITEEHSCHISSRSDLK